MVDIDDFFDSFVMPLFYSYSVKMQLFIEFITERRMNMTEESELKKATTKIEASIKARLVERHMSQIKLARLLETSPQWINRAIKGQNTPKAIEIRNKIYDVLGMNN